MSSFIFRGSKDGTIVEEKRHLPGEIGESEILVKVTHSGLCGTDLHYRHSGIVLGHEGIGVITRLGIISSRFFSINDRVGWGYKHGGCQEMRCSMCLEGNDTMCKSRQLYGVDNTDQGSFGSHMILKADHAFKIPMDYASKNAAPLMCAGSAVFGAIYNAQVKPTDKVAVVGFGGLGHLAVQFLRRMGCDVTVVTNTPDKKEDAKRLGANSVATLNELKEKNAVLLNYVIITAAIIPEWDAIVSVLERKGTVVVLTVGANRISCPYMPMVMNEFKILGSMEAPRHVVEKMLEFSARNKIEAEVEEISMNAVNIELALNRLERGDVRYRFVFTL